jgi:uncharacterized protein (TIGR00369 family)
MDGMIQHDRSCFVCGKKNPYGLSVQFEFINDKAMGVFHPNSHFQGYPGVLHGGIISSLLDGAMNRILLYHQKSARTGKLTVRFKKQSNTNDPLYIVGEIVNMRKRFAVIRAEIHNQKKELVAVGKATFILQE